MRRSFLTLLLSMAIIPAVTVKAAERVSAEQLEQRLAQLQSLSDGDAAAKIADLELTERFSTVQLAKSLAGLPGAKAQRALMGVADRAAFLAAPAAAAAPATPDMAEQ